MVSNLVKVKAKAFKMSLTHSKYHLIMPGLMPMRKNDGGKLLREQSSRNKENRMLLGILMEGVRQGRRLKAR